MGPTTMKSDAGATIRLLRKALAARPFTRGEIEAIRWDKSDPLAAVLDEAWIDLRIWVTDEDIRKKDPQYEERWRERLSGWVERLTLETHRT
jgi:hypothetical protein